MHSITKYTTLCFLILKTITAQEITTTLDIYNNLPVELKYEICSYLDLKNYSFKDLSCAIQQEEPHNIYFSQDNARMAKVDNKKEIVEIIDVKTNKPLYTINAKAINVDFNPHNLDQIVILNDDIFIYEKNSLTTRIPSGRPLAKFVPDNKILRFPYGITNDLSIWHISDRFDERFQHTEQISKIALNYDRTILAILFRDKTINTYKTGDKIPLTMNTPTNKGEISFIGFTNNNELISTAKDGVIINWDATEEIKTHHVINNAAIHPTNPFLLALCTTVLNASGFNYPTVLYDLTTKETIAEISSAEKHEWQFSPDGKMLFFNSTESSTTYDLIRFYKLVEFCKARMGYRKLNATTNEPETNRIALLQGNLLCILLKESTPAKDFSEVRSMDFMNKIFKTLPPSLQKIFTLKFNDTPL